MVDETHLAYLATNGFELSLPAKVNAVVRDFTNPKDVGPERDRLADYWFVHWSGGKLYHLRLKGGGPNVDGEQIELETRRHPWLLRARLEDAIGEIFHKYEPVRL